MKYMENKFKEAVRLHEQKKYEDAVNMLFDLVNEFPNFAIGYGHLASALRELGRFDEASRYAKITVEMLPKSKLASLILFHTFWDMAEFQLALNEIKRFKSMKCKLKDYDGIICELREKNLIDDALNWLQCE
jgi:tetratricopeptide (TPR) repeat protein